MHGTKFTINIKKQSNIDMDNIINEYKKITIELKELLLKVVSIPLNKQDILDSHLNKANELTKIRDMILKKIKDGNLSVSKNDISEIKEIDVEIEKLLEKFKQKISQELLKISENKQGIKSYLKQKRG